MNTLYVIDLDGTLLNTGGAINDLPMFRLSEEGYAVENAVTE